MLANNPIDPVVLDLITYDELFSILHEKFKVTHDELMYWIKKSLNYANFKTEYDSGDQPCNHYFPEYLEDDRSFLIPFSSDLPNMGMYEFPPDNLFYPECYFYIRQSALRFTPSPSYRFVYQRSLRSLRNWNDYESSHSLIAQTLLKANEYGILRFYNRKRDEFTLYDENGIGLWCHSFAGPDYVNDPDNFFLLHEILTLERVMFKKDRNECLRELGINRAGLSPNGSDKPANVYEFNKKY